jgi:hypothetical protein
VSNGDNVILASSSKLTATTALVNTLTDSSALPALVEKLEPRALQQLVETIGIEDAGSVIVHASATQMAHLVDESVWASVEPGRPESLSIADLLRWFELWVDIGDSFAAEKLVDLGEEFCAMALSKLVVVGTGGGGAQGADEYSQIIGTHTVSPRFDDEWDPVRTTLVALWDDYPDFLETILNRLNFRHSILGISGEDDLQSTLEADASYERETRKEARGFVGTATAGAFLHELAKADLDSLVEETSYDAYTAAYFQRRTRSALLDEDAQEPSNSTASSTKSTDPAAADSGLDSELDELQRDLEQYEIIHEQRVELLTGPATDAQPQLPIRQALAALVKDLDLFEQRSNELVYLSNTVMSQVTLGDTKLSEAQAANLALATCNLGGSYLLWIDAREALDADVNAYGDLLSAEPGLVKLFRIGWNLLQHLPAQATNRMSQALSGAHTAEILATRPWLIDEVSTLLHDPDIVSLAKDRDFFAVRETLKVLSIVLEPGALEVLNLLIDDLPRLARALDHTDLDAIGPVRERYITCMQDLFLLDRYLGQLHHQVKGQQ